MRVCACVYIVIIVVIMVIVAILNCKMITIPSILGAEERRQLQAIYTYIYLIPNSSTSHHVITNLIFLVFLWSPSYFLCGLHYSIIKWPLFFLSICYLSFWSSGMSISVFTSCYATLHTLPSVTVIHVVISLFLLVISNIVLPVLFCAVYSFCFI